MRMVLALVILAVVAVGLSDALGPRVDVALQHSQAILREHAVFGKVLFTALAVASPMLAFFSSSVLVPVAISAWGAPTTFALLWLGWIGGGITAYTIARSLGRAAVHRLTSSKKLTYYEERVGSDVRWWMLLLLQLALPSELPGYLAGLLRIRFHHYVAALALGELPYAIGTVSLGDAFVQKNVLMFAVVLIAGIALLSGAFHVLHVQLARRSPARSSASSASSSASSVPRGASSSVPSSASSGASSVPSGASSSAPSRAAGSAAEDDAQFEPAPASTSPSR